MTGSSEGSPPTISDIEPSRGDDHVGEKGDKSSASTKARKSKSHGSTRSGHHGSSSSGRHRASPHQSSNSGSLYKTPDSTRTGKDKLRLANKTNGSEIMSSPPLNSPGAQNVSGSNSRESRKAARKNRKGQQPSPSMTSPGAQNVSSSDGNATRKSSKFSRARQANDSSTPVLTSPGGRNMSSSSDGDAKRKASKGVRSSRQQRTPGITQSTRNSRVKANAGTEIRAPALLGPVQASDATMPMLEATAAPDVEEQIEAARKQAREEGRMEERNERTREEERQRQRQIGEIDTIVATPPEENKISRKCMLIALVVFLLAIGGGVIAWQLLSGKSSTSDEAQPLSKYDPPTEEDCLSVSQGLGVEGQNNTAADQVGLEMNIVMASDINIELLRGELEAKIQQDVLPLLVGCGIDNDVSIENNVFILENAKFNMIDIGDPRACSTNFEELCSSAYLEMDVFSKDDDELDESVLRLIRDVFQDEGTLELLNLASPVRGIESTRVFQVQASSSPSSNPSKEDGVAGDDSTNPTASPSTVQQTESPSRNPTWAPVAYPTTNDPTRSPTLAPSVNPTWAPVTYPTTTDPTKSPTLAPAFDPTTAPVTFPTTQAPTSIPTPVPTLQPVVGPTLEPTPFPTPNPTLSPTVESSELPSADPTPKPSMSPTAGPTPRPSSQPSVSPTMQPITPLPTASPSTSPSAPPSVTPKPCFQTSTELSNRVEDWFDKPENKALTEEQYGPIGAWCFGAGVTSMEKLFSSIEVEDNVDLSLWDVSSVITMEEMFSKSSFNGDLSSWNVSSVMNMRGMFNDARSFNQDLSSWDVSSVTDMRSMFNRASSFNGDISSWDVSSVITMDQMFDDATAFNQPLSSWDVSSVITMEQMFNEARAFNQPLSSWDVSSVITMARMFRRASSFNQDLSSWDVSSVTKMRLMFSSGSSFNGDISSWDVSSVTSTYGMFLRASSFNQNLCPWGSRIPSSAVSVTDMFNFTSCPSQSDPDLSSNPPGPFCYDC
ncbi:unnamed protein product [Cylindrotheca closterium]|uniref:Circumsporozoite protein n=1 Tax=Cylindrotheca closterium TaxID=2856 RepID=A0AAD2FE72_9STRA|nr:unnamed protein product [Cylindrotheca closterium]